MVWQIAGEAPNLDVHKSSTAYLQGYGPGAAYSGLVKPQPLGHGNKVTPVADLAENWEQPDPTTYVFRLRKNAKFHNVAPVNGRAATAQDVVYSFKRQLAEKVNASFLAGIKTMDAVDAGTVRMILDGPNVDFIASLVDPRNKVVAQEAVEKSGDLTNGPTIGTGPWVFKSWERGIAVSLTRNPDYFLAGIPYADELNMPVLKDPAAIEAQFLAGQITVAQLGAGGTGLTPKRMEQLDKKKFAVYRGASICSMGAMLNMEEFKDIRLRKALSLAIDRQLIIDNVLDGYGELDGGWVVLPGPDWKLSKEELKKSLTSDLKAAKALYDQAGGAKKLTMPFYESAAVSAAAQLVQANWKALGFDIDLRSIDNNELQNIYSPATGKLTGIAAVAILHAPNLTSDLETWMQTGGTRNGGKISDPELDQLIKAQKSEFDANKRKELVLQIQRRIIDQVYLMPFVAPTSMYGYATGTHNVEPTYVNGEHRWFSEVWFDA